MKGIDYFSTKNHRLSNKLMLKSIKLLYSICFVIYLYFTVYHAKAQHSISPYEFRWAFVHPFAAIKIKHRLPKAMLVYNEVKQKHLLDTFEFGGKLDAFRHTYVMAYLAQNIKVKKLRKLGIAHEKGNKCQFEKQKMEEGERADSLACDMDLRNNELGFLIGSTYNNIDTQALKQKVIDEITSGNAWYLKRNGKYEWVDCKNQLVQVAHYKGIWFIPKCLIKTNE